MADQYLQELTGETVPVATDFMVITDNGTQRLRKIKYGLINFEIQTSTPDTNVTGEVGVLDVVTMSSMTADRDYTLPTTATVGDRCGIAVVDGNDTYEILIKSGAAGDKINNVDHSSTEWSRLFIAGEKVTFVCIDAAGPHWLVETDGRIPCVAEIYRTTIQSIPSASTTKILMDSVTIDNANLTDIISNYRINIRRAGMYFGRAAASIPGCDLGEQFAVYFDLNDAAIAEHNDYSPYADYALSKTAISLVKLAVGDYISTRIYQASGNTQDTYTDISKRPVLSIVEKL